MSHENEADQSAELRAARTKSECAELLALAGNYQEVMPQLLELLKQYYEAEQVDFCECGEADHGKAGEYAGQAAGCFWVPVMFEGRQYGNLRVRTENSVNPDRSLLFDVAHVLAAEIWKKKLQDYLLHLSYHDQLTGIRNNTSYIRMMEHLLAHPVPVGVAFADLNGLKYLNDTYGHEYGDRALKHLAEVCREYFAENQLYRISGDEFVVICREVQETEFIRQAELLKKRLKQEERDLAAFGYLWDDGSTSADKLLHRAERLMYEEKRLHYQDSARRVQECPGYAEEFIQQCRRKRNH